MLQTVKLNVIYKDVKLKEPQKSLSDDNQNFLQFLLDSIYLC